MKKLLSVLLLSVTLIFGFSPQAEADSYYIGYSDPYGELYMDESSVVRRSDGTIAVNIYPTKFNSVFTYGFTTRGCEPDQYLYTSGAGGWHHGNLRKPESEWNWIDRAYLRCQQLLDYM